MNENITAIEKRATEAHTEAAAIIIRDQDSLAIANGCSQALKGLIKQIDDCFKPIYDAQREAAGVTKATWAKYRDPLDLDYRRIKDDIGRFLQEQERIRREAEHKAWQAEMERIRVKAEAEEQAAVALRKAQEAEAKGQVGKAEKILNEAAAEETKTAEKIAESTTAAAVQPPARPKTTGVSIREDWDIELVDLAQVPREYLMFDEVKARRVVRASKGDVQIPGVKNIKKAIVAQR